ncbi:MAG: leucine-rich repeat protein, partial [Alistipes sp.]|nr:leucine-rich repeat protein [Alistipes sp.]
RIGRVVFDGEVISVERNEEMADYPSWGYNTRAVTLPPTIKTIGLHTFYQCPAITRIDILKSVTSISEKAIHGCSKLAEIYCEATTPPAGASGMFVLDNDNCKIYVPNESVEAYKEAEGWKDYASQIYGYTFN